MYSKSSKNSFVLFLLILAGIVLGSFIGHYLGSLPYLEWLKFGREFGIGSPAVIELGILKLQFSLLFRFNISGIIGIIISIFVYRKM